MANRTRHTSRVHADGRAVAFTRFGASGGVEVDRRRAELAAMRDMGHVVYLARVGDLVKIGTTGAIRERLRRLGVERASLLAVIPGGRAEEVALLERFAASLDRGREWFRPTPDLIDYINEARAAVGIPLVESW